MQRPPFPHLNFLKKNTFNGILAVFWDAVLFTSCVNGTFNLQRTYIKFLLKGLLNNSKWSRWKKLLNVKLRSKAYDRWRNLCATLDAVSGHFAPWSLRSPSDRSIQKAIKWTFVELTTSTSGTYWYKHFEAQREWIKLSWNLKQSVILNIELIKTNGT